jgi:O-antigen/teichoic acid export membrane protein
MNSAHRTVARNASFLMASQLITWGLAVLLMIFMPRYLGAAGIGRIQLASSIWTVMTIFIAFGMDTLMIKEIARNPARTAELFSISVILRAIFFVFGFGIVALYAHLARYPLETLYVIGIIGFANFILQFTSACTAALQGLERMEFFSLSDVISKIFITLTTIILLLAGYGVLPAAAVLVGSAAISLVIQLVPLNRMLPLRLHFDLPQALWMLKASFPYLLSVGIRTIYSQIDIIIISLLVSDVVIGWYGSAVRLFATLLFVPAGINTAIFPVMSRTFANSPDSLPRLFRKNFSLMLILGVPIGLGVLVIADPLVVLLYGKEFVNSGPVLAVMGIVLMMTYQNIILGQYLISTDRQNAWTTVMAFATLATIPLDLVFIPLCQVVFNNAAIGGALSFLVTEAGMVAAGLWLLPRGILQRSSAWMAVRVFLAGGAMVAAAWMLRGNFILLPIAVGAVTYVALILILRVVPKEDWILARSLMQSIYGRLLRPKPEAPEAGGTS